MKLLTFLKKHEDLYTFLFFLIVVLPPAIFRTAGNYDEIWNYGFALRMAVGDLPYRDFNLLQTPFAAFVNSISLRLFGHALSVIRVNGALLFAGIAFLITKIVRKLDLPRFLGVLLGLTVIFFFLYNLFFEYSDAIIFLQLLLIFIDLCLYQQKSVDPLLLFFSGILGGIALLCKQTFGAFIALASCLSAVLLAIDKKQKKLTYFFLRALGAALPCILFLLYLLISGTFQDFLDMCFFGISSFSARYSYTYFMNDNTGNFIFGILLPAVLVLSFVSSLFLYRKENYRQFALIEGSFFLYGFFGFSNIIPMANDFHMLTSAIGILTCLFPLAALLKEKLGRFPLTGKVLKVLSLACLIGSLLAAGHILFVHTPNNLKDTVRSEYPHLGVIWLKEEDDAEMKEVTAYIAQAQSEGHDVYVLDNDAERFLIPSLTYHKYLDMFLYGNLGTKEPAACLEESLAPDNIYLIPDADRKNTQFPRKEINVFRTDHLVFLHRLGQFMIYEVNRVGGTK
ncbi:MAG: hypothetical protein IKE21_07050 [Erysipelotrichaceae bacterium]|nr:hypothetical protein [Erysipelotrichaceae bacterium]